MPSPHWWTPLPAFSLLWRIRSFGHALIVCRNGILLLTPFLKYFNVFLWNLILIFVLFNSTWNLVVFPASRLRSSLLCCFYEMLLICCLPFWNPPSPGLFLFFHLDSLFHLSLLTSSCSVWTYFQQFLLIVGLCLRREFCLVISESSRGPKRPLQASPLPHTASRV